MFLANPITPGHGKEGSLDFGPCTTGSTDLAITTVSPAHLQTDGQGWSRSGSIFLSGRYQDRGSAGARHPHGVSPYGPDVRAPAMDGGGGGAARDELRVDAGRAVGAARLPMDGLDLLRTPVLRQPSRFGNKTFDGDRSLDRLSPRGAGWERIAFRLSRAVWAWAMPGCEQTVRGDCGGDPAMAVSID